MPTRTTALISGIVLGFVMPLQEAAATSLSLSPQARSLLLYAAVTVVFFVPVMLFVVGVQHLSMSTKDVATRLYWRSLGQIAIRGLCWLFGAGAAFALLSALSPK